VANAHEASMGLRALIFDLNGTLTDTLPLCCASLANAFAQFGLPARADPPSMAQDDAERETRNQILNEGVGGSNPLVSTRDSSGRALPSVGALRPIRRRTS
jgi:phosphoglycolate phosphatase-like HAD superfamily hydrolase